MDTAASLPAPDRLELKEPGEFRLIGKALPRLEVPDMVMGRTRYGIDTALPQMLYAAVLRCPVFGGRVARFDASAAHSNAGVHAVLQTLNAGARVERPTLRAEDLAFILAAR